MPVKINFKWMLVDFGRQNGGKLAPKSNEKSMWTATGEFLKNLVFHQENNDFEGSGGSKINDKFNKNRLKNEAENEMALVVDFLWY